MKYLIIMSLIICSCNSNTFKIEKVSEIEVVNLFSNTMHRITDKEKQQHIISTIEKSKKEPVKFIAEYKLKVIIEDSVIVFLVKDNLLNYKGVTYKMRGDLSENIKNDK